MFEHMTTVLAVGALVAVVVFAAAFAAEGRGQRLIRLLLGEERRRPLREHLFDEIDRPDSTLDVVGGLAHPDTRELRTLRG